MSRRSPFHSSHLLFSLSSGCGCSRQGGGGGALQSVRSARTSQPGQVRSDCNKGSAIRPRHVAAPLHQWSPSQACTAAFLWRFLSLMITFSHYNHTTCEQLWLRRCCFSPRHSQSMSCTRQFVAFPTQAMCAWHWLKTPT
ncbi:unnamed protein product, partial [Closterium sp. NIES-53]